MKKFAELLTMRMAFTPFSVPIEAFNFRFYICYQPIIVLIPTHKKTQAQRNDNLKAIFSK